MYVHYFQNEALKIIVVGGFVEDRQMNFQRQAYFSGVRAKFS